MPWATLFVYSWDMSEKTSFWFTNAWVHGTGFVLSLVQLWMLKDGSLLKLPTVNKLYWLGGCMGVVMVFAAPPPGIG